MIGEILGFGFDIYGSAWAVDVQVDGLSIVVERVGVLAFGELGVEDVLVSSLLGVGIGVDCVIVGLVSGHEGCSKGFVPLPEPGRVLGVLGS